MRIAMNLEPLLRRGRCEKTFEITSRVQAMPPQFPEDKNGTLIFEKSGDGRDSIVRQAAD